MYTKYYFLFKIVFSTALDCEFIHLDQQISQIDFTVWFDFYYL